MIYNRLYRQLNKDQFVKSKCLFFFSKGLTYIWSKRGLCVFC